MGYAPGSTVKYPEKKLNELRAYLAKVNSDQSKVLFTRKEEIYNTRLQDKKFAKWLQEFTHENSKNPSLPVPEAAYFSFDDLDHSSFNDNWNIDDKEQYNKIIRPKTGKYGPGIFIENGQNYSLGKHEYITGKHPFTIAFWYFNMHKNGKTLLSKMNENSGVGLKIVSNSGYLQIVIQESAKDPGTSLVCGWIKVSVLLSAVSYLLRLKKLLNTIPPLMRS